MAKLVYRGGRRCEAQPRPLDRRSVPLDFSNTKRLYIFSNWGCCVVACCIASPPTGQATHYTHDVMDHVSEVKWVSHRFPSESYVRSRKSEGLEWIAPTNWFRLKLRSTAAQT